MAVTSIQESWSPTTTSEQSQDGVSGMRTARRVLTVLVDDPVADTEMTVKAAAGVPKISDLHPRDNYMYCTSVNISRKAPIMYEVEAEYGVQVLSIGAGSGGPLDAAPTIEFGSIRNEEEFDMDPDGNPIATVLGEPFNPPLTTFISDGVIRINRKMATFNELFYSSYWNKTNSDTFGVYPPGTVLCVDISARSIGAGSTFYFDVNFEFHVRRGAPHTTDDKAWYKRVPARGFYVKNLADQTVRARDNNGNGYPTEEPVWHQVDNGMPSYVDYGGTPEFYYFKQFGSAPFYLLGAL